MQILCGDTPQNATLGTSNPLAQINNPPHTQKIHFPSLQLWEAQGKRKPSLHRCELWSISTPAFLTQSVSDNYKLVTRHRSQHTGLLAAKRTGRWEYIRRAVNQPAHRFATREGMVRDKNRDAISEQPLKVSAKRSTSVPEQRRDGWHCFLEK